MDVLPEELLLNTLHRMPVKSIGCYLCVKKSWGSLIKTPSFVFSDSKIYNKNDQYLSLWGSSKWLELRRDNDNLGSYKLLTLPVEVGDILGDAYTICCISVCNGLICFFSYPDILMLWNPTIHGLLSLPQPTLVVDEVVDEIVPENTVTLWFDSLTDDYKVIRFICYWTEEKIEMVEPLQLQIFSLNNNSWRIISETAPPFEIDGPSIPLRNGILNWIGYSDGDPRMKWNSILVFDVNAEVFWLIELPNILKTHYGRFFNVSVYKETSIAICCNESVDEPMEVWVMKEYRNVESWTNIWKNDPLHQPLHASPCGVERHVIGLLNNGKVLWEVLVWLRETGGKYKAIISTDPESGIMKTRVVVPCTFHTEDVRFFEESLVLLDNASALSTARRH